MTETRFPGYAGHFSSRDRFHRGASFGPIKLGLGRYRVSRWYQAETVGTGTPSSLDMSETPKSRSVAM